MATRTNLCPNPAMKNNTTGYFGSVSRSTSLTGMPRSTGNVQGTSELDMPQGVVSSSFQYTFSAYFKATSSGTLRYSIDWYVGGSYYTSTSTFSFTVTSGGVYRPAITATPPFGATRGLFITTGVNGQTTCVLYEQGSVLGTYFDGDEPGGSWTGTSGNSTSTILSNVLQTVTPSGIPSLTTFGTTAVIKEPAKVISPAGIASSLVFGTAVLSTGPVDVFPTGIPSEEAFGTAKEIDGFLLGVHSISSLEAFGTPVVSPGPVTVHPTGIPSAATFGFTVVTRIQVAIPAALATKPSDATKYEMVVVARLPQPSGPPTFVEVDSLNWTGLSWTDTISKPSILAAGVSVSSLSDAIIQRLQDMSHKACEIWVYRNGKKVFSGPWWTWQVQSETLTINAKSAVAYLDQMGIMTDQVFSQVDQFLIGKTLVDQFQSLDYGNYGIDTSDLANQFSGVLRDATYLQNELDYVGQQLYNLGTRLNGFDFAVDPTSRKLQFYYPSRGVDRSTGESAIVFDARNVTNTNVICSAAPQDVASEAIGTGTNNTAGDGTIYSVASNLDLRAQYGRSVIMQNFQGVSEQPTLDAYTQALVAARGTALMVPGPNVTVTPDADLDMYDVGDTVSYQLHQKLGIQGAFRLLSRQVVVSATGKETITPTFV
jgi:hypothetical protein